MFSLKNKKLGSLFWGILIALVSACGNDGGGGVVSIQITPTEATIRPGESLGFTATVAGTDNPAVDWSVVESGGGSVDTSGVYQSPSATGIFHVVATSLADPSQSATAAVTVRLPAGSTDTTFGIEGKAMTPLGSGSDVAQGMALQPDGKMVIVGSSFNGKDSDLIVARYTQSGLPDITFGTGGTVLIDFGSADEGHAVAVDSFGRIVVAGSALNAGNSEFAVARLNPTGLLDATFGFEGKVATPIGVESDVATALVLRSNGDIVVAGSVQINGTFDFAVARYDSSGRLDPAFGTNGVVITSIGAEDDFVFAVALQSTGEIVVAGDTFNGSDFDFAMARYTATGALDATFNGGGTVTSPIGESDDAIRAMVIRSDNKILVSGISNTIARPDVALAQYTAAGALDPTFDNGGIVVTPVGARPSAAFAMKLLDGGKFLVAGVAFNVFTSDFVLLRYLETGGLDSTFGNAGIVTTDFDAGEEIAFAVAIGLDGKIWVAGESILEGNRDMALARYQADDGALDPLFGTGGKRKLNLKTGSGSVQSLVIQPDGKFIAAGELFDGRDSIFTLVRYQANGTVDETFGKKGTVRTLFNGGTGGDIALQPDGKIIAVGTFLDPNDPTADFDFALIRFLPDGQVDPAFGVGGGLTLSSGGGARDLAGGVVLQPDGKILVAGSASIGGNVSFLLVRLLPNGTPDPAFGQSGFVLTPIVSGSTVRNGIALQPDGKILVTGQAENGAVVLRHHPDGSLDTSFGTGGILTTQNTIDLDNDGGSDALLVQKDGKIVLGGSVFDVDHFEFVLERYHSDGTLDQTFGTRGRATAPFSSGNEAIRGLMLQEDGKIIAIGFSNISTSDFVLVRYNPDGTLDETFAARGILNVPVGTETDYANVGLLQPDGKIVVAGGAVRNGPTEFALARFWP